MPPTEPRTPSPEWREARHRLRNDLQTLSSLLRLGRRRAPAEALVAVFPEWLSALADLYQALPDPAEGTASLRALAGDPSCCVVSGDARIADGAALAAGLAVRALTAFCRNAAGPAGDILMEIQDGPGITVRARFAERAGEPPAWPPLDLTLAMEALGGEAILNRGVDESVAALEFPCP